MQCVNCGFENIPGMQQCVRCQSSLELATVAIAPPRAGRFHLGSRLRRFWNGIGPALKRIGQYRVDWRVWLYPRQYARWEVVVLSAFVPGLGQICYRGRILGVLLLATWLGCLVPALLMYGSNLCITLMSIAIFTHVLAILLPMGRNLVEGTARSRCLTGLGVFAGLLFGLYLPAEWTIRRIWGVVPMGRSILLVDGPWRRPDTFQRGDFVLYQIHRFGAAHGDAVYVGEGYGMDRILGVPGDVVEIRNEQLLVNGQPVPPGMGPIGGLPRYGNRVIPAGPDAYVILPTSVGFNWDAERVDPASILLRVSRVPASDIVGRVTYRTYPWSDRGPVR